MNSRFNAQTMLPVLALLLLAMRTAWGLTLEVELESAHPAPGQRVQTRLLVGNDTGAVAENVRLELVFPEDFDSLGNDRISDSGNCSATGFVGDCRSGEPVVWQLGDLAAGEIRSVFLVPRLDNAAVDGQVIDFDASAFVDGSLAATAVRSLAVDAEPILALALQADADPVAPGQRVRVWLNYAQRGTGATSNTELRLPLPAGTSLVEASGNGVLDGGDLVWDLGLLNPGDKGRQTATLEVSPALPAGALLDIADAVFRGELEFETTQTGAGAVVAVGPPGPLLLALVVDEDLARPDTRQWVRAMVSNRGAGTLADVTVELLFPEGLDVLGNDRILDGGNCSATGFVSDCRAGEPVVWNLGALGPGQGRTVALAPRVLSGTDDGSALVYQVRARAAGEAGQWSRQVIRVEPAAPLRLGLAARTDPVLPGGALVLDLRFGNAGAVTASNGVLELPLPAGVTASEISDGGSLVDGTVVWNLGLLDPGEIGRRRVELGVDGALVAGDLLRFDRVRLSGDVAFATRSAHARTAVRVTAAPELGAAIAMVPDPVRADEQLPGEIVVTNRTAGLMTDVAVTLLMPEGFDVMSNDLVSDGGNCAASGFSGDCRSGEPLVWALGSLPPGQGRTVRFQPILGNAPEAGALHRFEARVRNGAGAERWSRQHVPVAAGPGPGLHLNASNSPVAPNARLDYELHIANAGPTALTEGVVTLPLPEGVTVIDAGGGRLVDGRLEWPVALLETGENDVRRARLRVDAGVPAGRVLDTEARLSGQFGLAMTENRAISPVRVEAASPLSVEIDLVPDPVRPDERLVPRLSVANRGPGVLTGVRVDMPYPDGIDLVSNDLIVAGGNCSGSRFSGDCRRAEPVIWDLGTLPPDSGRTFWLPPEVTASTPSGRLIRMRPRVVAEGQRPVHTEATAAVEAAAALRLGLDFDPSPAAPGAATRIVLRFGNTAAEPVSEAVLRMPLPEGLQVTAVDGNGIVGDSEVLWDIGPIPAGRVGRREVSLSIDADAVPGSLVRPLRAMLIGSLDTTPVRASADGTLRLAAGAPLEITLDFRPELADPGTMLSGQLTVTNRTATQMPDVSAALYFPSFLDVLSNSAIADGGNCSASGFSFDCRAGETVRWTLGTLGPGETRVLGIDPTIVSGAGAPPDGTLITFLATADNTTAGQADARATVAIGEFLAPPPPPEPEITVRGNGIEIANGDTTPSVADGTDFGSADFDGETVERGFTIGNSNTGDLEILSVSIAGAHPADFRAVSAPVARIGPGEQSTLTVRFDPETIGLRSATVTIASNDADESPYVFSVAGQGLDPSGQLLFKDGFE